MWLYSIFWKVGCKGFLGSIVEEGYWEVVCWVGLDLARRHNCIVLIGVDESGCCWVYFDVAKQGQPCVFVNWCMVHHNADQGECLDKDCYVLWWRLRYLHNHKGIVSDP